MAHRRASRSVSPKRKPESPDLNALADERWRLLLRGVMKLLRREEPRAYRRLWAALERHGLAAPMMYFRSDRQSGQILPYSETMSFASGVVNDFRRLPRELIDDVLARARAFDAEPDVGRLQGKKRIRRASPQELLLAYQAARWKLESDAKVRGVRLREEPLTYQAWALVGKKYNLEAETVGSYLQDARRSVPPKTRKILALLTGNAAWEMTLGAKSGGPKK